MEKHETTTHKQHMYCPTYNGLCSPPSKKSWLAPQLPLPPPKKKMVPAVVGDQP